MMICTVMVCSQLGVPGCFDFFSDELMKYSVIGQRNECCLFMEVVAIDGLYYVYAK